MTTLIFGVEGFDNCQKVLNPTNSAQANEEAIEF
jgi:hypothetical protein